jgi:DNA-directed RNA polymerase subunit RPC12/RpoP
MTRRERLAYAAAAAYAWAGAGADTLTAAPAAVAREVRNVWRQLGPAIALARPLHCTRCNRTQHYASRSKHQLLAEGGRVRCWQCGRRMVRKDGTR